MASRPVILTVDDDPEVLRAIERDLKRRYVRDYRVLSVASGEAGLELLRELEVRGEPVALLLADQRMPGMTGVDFLEAAAACPHATRAILTAYADTGAAIGAINRARIDYYFQKPWDPPEQNLYPALDDLLDDWRAGFPPRLRGDPHHRPALVAAGARHQRLPRPQPGALPRPGRRGRRRGGGAAGQAGLDPRRLPVVLFADGTALVQPPPREVADRAGLKTHADRPFYDLAIVGAGPAGLAAAVYGASEGLKHGGARAEAPGGQAGTSR